jgi:two-component system osmolarity sensor histidine kinase EnvZ
MELSIALREGEALPISPRNSFFSILDKTLRRSLEQSLEDPFWFDTTRYPNHIDIRVSVDEGVLRLIAARERVFAPTGYVFIFWLVTASVLLTLISILFIRNQSRPISRLADAADAFGRGQDISDFKPSGAAEVRLAGQSFMKMRQRLRRYIDQRTDFLAGVSHDLRTPLTRLKLHLAMQEDTDETRAARQDLKDMETMLDGYLNFAKDNETEETEIIQLDEFVRAIIVGQRDKEPELEIIGTPIISGKPNALRRAIENLISNAHKYGGAANVTVSESTSAVEICVEDDGPGIPESDRATAFKPFQRLDSARNQNIEGVGLGLSISRDIVQAHGGNLTLHDSDLGGLKAVISIPK